MEELVRSNAGLEVGIKPLVAVLKVSKLSDACKILFINGDVLSLSMPLKQVGMVTLQGSEDANMEGADLVISESKLQITDIAKKIMPLMIQSFGDSFVSASVEVASIQNEEERQSIISAKIMERAKNYDTTVFMKQITPYIGGGIKPVSILLVGVLYKFFYEKHVGQRQAIPGFENVADSMKRLGLISPFLSLALCPSCNNYELVFSKSVRSIVNCPKCGSTWPILVVNELTPALTELKMKNCDLPVFISAYLGSKSPLTGKVVPNAEFCLKKGKVEVDVFIPDTLTGIECKCYANNLTVTDSTITSEAGKIKQQITNYLQLGLRRVIVVTNYSEADTKKLRAGLKEQLEGLKGLKEWKVIGNDLNAFVKFLDEESERINKVIGKRIQRDFGHRIAKQLGGEQNKKRKAQKNKGSSAIEEPHV